MGLARLLAKGWIVVCFFAGAHALRFALQGGGDVAVVVPQVIVAVLLFAAMGLLFVGGFGASGTSFRVHDLHFSRPKWPSPPGFNAVVFVTFVALSFLDQVWYAPRHLGGPFTEGLEGALYFAIPGHAVIVDRLGECALDGGRVFASAFAWFLATIFAASAISRLKSAADIIRLERKARPGTLGATTVAAMLGAVAVLGIQCIFVGSAMALLPCSAFAGIPGAVVIGLAPLLLAYLIFAALASLLASGSES